MHRSRIIAAIVAACRGVLALALPAAAGAATQQVPARRRRARLRRGCRGLDLLRGQRRHLPGAGSLRERRKQLPDRVAAPMAAASSAPPTRRGRGDRGRRDDDRRPGKARAFIYKGRVVAAASDVGFSLDRRCQRRSAACGGRQLGRVHRAPGRSRRRRRGDDADRADHARRRRLVDQRDPRGSIPRERSPPAMATGSRSSAPTPAGTAILANGNADYDNVVLSASDGSGGGKGGAGGKGKGKGGGSGNGSGALTEDACWNCCARRRRAPRW